MQSQECETPRATDFPATMERPAAVTSQTGPASMTPSSLIGALEGHLDCLPSSPWTFPMLCPLPGAVCVLCTWLPLAHPAMSI